MEDLIKRLVNDAGISEEQAAKVLDSIKGFITEKFPMMAGAVDSLLQSKDADDDPLA